MVRQRRQGGAWYYQFIRNGKRYAGRCEAATKREAEAYERRIMATVERASEQKTVKALIDNFRDELTGGKKIALDEAFELAEQKPRSRIPAEKYAGMKRTAWGDFLAFMHGEHPDIENLIDVTEAHAQEYISILQKTGRYDKNISYSRGTGKKAKTITTRKADGALSARTVRLHQTVCAEVFTRLAKDAGLQDNPFSGIEKMKSDTETREAFTPEELKTIYDNLDGFTRPLFMLAVWTGLREGDICTLRWKDVDLRHRSISRRTRKTGADVEIPISNQLYEYLTSIPQTKSGYLFPQHAEMYLTNSTGVSYRIKQFLEGLGIQTTRKVKGRARAVSVKDLHSCRHTFCYYAGLAGIPLSVVQSIVGHMSPEMTKHYSAHASMEDKRRGMERLSFFTQDALPAADEEPERAELRSLLDTLPIEQVRKMLATCVNVIPEQSTNRNEQNFANTDYMITTPTQCEAFSFRTLKVYYVEKGGYFDDCSFEANMGLKTPQGQYNLLAELMSDKNTVPLIVAKFKGRDKTSIFERSDYGYQCILFAFEQVKNRLAAENICICDTTVRPRMDNFLFDFNCATAAFINALMYNDWTQSQPLISLFEDRLEILSHGGIPNGETVEMFFQGISKPRNDMLMRLFLNMELTEHTGHVVPTIVSKYGRESFQIKKSYINIVIPFDTEVLKQIKRNAVV